MPPTVPVKEKIAVKPVAKKKTPAKKTVKKSTPVIDESILDVEATVPVQPVVSPLPVVKEEAPTKPKTGGLADAIARAKQIKQEAIVPPRQAAQQQPGVKKI